MSPSSRRLFFQSLQVCTVAASTLFASVLPAAAQAPAAPAAPAAAEPSEPAKSPAKSEAAGDKWEKEIAGIEQRDAAANPPKGGIVFIGSSSIRMWQSLANDFPNYNVVNHGFGGSEVSDSVRYVDRLVFPLQPRMVVMYAGGNDIHAGKSPERVADDFRAFVEKVRAKLPNAEIAYISIAGNPSRWAEVEKVKKANALVADYCRTVPHLQFIDVFSHMLGADGLPRPEIFREDRLHMNPEGYKLWTQVVGPHLGTADR